MANKTPYYYVGDNGYEAAKVVDGFDCTYHVGTAVTYLLRCKRKHPSPVEDIQKAIHHLEYELARLETLE